MHQSCNKQIIFPTSHPIIPSQILSHFHHNSNYSLQNENILSRSATIAEAICRVSSFVDKHRTAIKSRHDEDIDNIFNYDLNEGTFTIHLIGCDNVEGGSRGIIKNNISPLVKWIRVAILRYSRYHKDELNEKKESTLSLLSKIIHLNIVLIGPNIPVETVRLGSFDFLPSIVDDICDNQEIDVILRSCKVTCDDRLYHDVLMNGLKSNSEQKYKPDLVIAFNSGMWAYDEWIPTLRAMCEFDGGRFPLIVTAYTLEEAQDDADVIEDVIFGSLSASNGTCGLEDNCTSSREGDDLILQRSLWKAEINPFGSRIKRKPTLNMPFHLCCDSHAWQAWIFGRQH